MGSRRKTIKKCTPKVKQRLETLKMKGELFFPCKICGRLFKEELKAVEHFQDCKPEDLEEDGGEKSNGNLNIEQNPNNNNYIENSETKKRRRITRSSANNVEESACEESTPTCNNNKSVPKKKSIIHIKNNIQISFVNEAASVPRNSVNSQPENKNIINRSRRGKKLTEEEIAERLRIISERLKIKSEVKVACEDEEEEERREIEDKLTALNKDSESTPFNEYPEYDDRIQGEDDRTHLESKNTLVRKLVENSRGMSEGPLNPEVLEGLNCLNPTPISKEPIIITQSADGEPRDCPSCSEVFISELALLRHKREKHTYPKIIMALEEVKKLYDSPDRSSCPICKKNLTIKTKSMFVKHLQIHTYIGEHECSICKKKFKRLDHMKTHKKRHITPSFI